MNNPKRLFFPAVLTCAASFAVAQTKPNVIFIMADDMGYECFGPYGSPYQTPHIDRLARQGVIFDYAYSQPLSTPSRVEVMTGRYNYCNYSRFGFLNQDQKTFGDLARMAGYSTAIVGKWQLGGNPDLPNHFGFDNYCLWQLNYGRGADGVGERYANPLIEQDGKVVEHNRNLYGPDVFADYVDNYIDSHKDKPFFLYYPMVLAHDPFVSTPDSPDWDENINGRFIHDTKYFSDMVTYCDKMVGRLVDKLKETGLYDNTLLIFTADNGTLPQITTIMKDGTKIKGGKSYATEAGTHAPLIVTYGSRQCAPYLCSDLIDFTDILPTIGEAIGMKAPAEWDVHGHSFLSKIVGKKGFTRKWVFVHYDPVKKGGEAKARRFIRDHRYKLYSTGEMYDMDVDRLETQNIEPGTGTREAEKARKFLFKQMKKFPQWEIGDPPADKVEYPQLHSVLKKYDEASPLEYTD